LGGYERTAADHRSRCHLLNVDIGQRYGLFRRPWDLRVIEMATHGSIRSSRMRIWRDGAAGVPTAHAARLETAGGRPVGGGGHNALQGEQILPPPAARRQAGE